MNATKTSDELKHELEALQDSVPYGDIERLRKEIVEAQNRECVGRYYRSSNRPNEVSYYKVMPNHDSEQWYLRGLSICLTSIILPDCLTEITESEFKEKLSEFQRKLAE